MAISQGSKLEGADVYALINCYNNAIGYNANSSGTTTFYSSASSGYDTGKVIKWNSSGSIATSSMKFIHCLCNWSTTNNCSEHNGFYFIIEVAKANKPNWSCDYVYSSVNAKSNANIRDTFFSYGNRYYFPYARTYSGAPVLGRFMYILCSDGIAVLNVHYYSDGWKIDDASSLPIMFGWLNFYYELN